MPELDKITIEGFKSIASIKDLQLGAINVLIGPNGSGKSNFIGVFSFLHAIRDGRLAEYVARAGGAARLLHFGPKRTSKIHICISFQGGANQYDTDLIPTEADELVVSGESVVYSEKIGYDGQMLGQRLPQASNGAEGSLPSTSSKRAKYVQSHLDRWRIYHFHDTGSFSAIRSTADLNDNRFLRADGSNLAAFLYFLKLKHPASYSLIQRTVQRVAPFFEDFQLAPQELNPDKLRMEWRHKGSDAYFDASSLSDGTLRFIALATLFLQPKTLRPSVILVDEPELGLHPYAITLLASLVKQASIETQVILSTQSPLLLDHFNPEDVLVADRVQGGTQISRLRTPELENWLKDYSLGQLWEKNEIGGRPGTE